MSDVEKLDRSTSVSADALIRTYVNMWNQVTRHLEDVADALNLEVGNLRTRIYQARVKLRSQGVELNIM